MRRRHRSPWRRAAREDRSHPSEARLDASAASRRAWFGGRVPRRSGAIPTRVRHLSHAGQEDTTLRWLRRHDEREYSVVDVTGFERDGGTDGPAGARVRRRLYRSGLRRPSTVAVARTSAHPRHRPPETRLRANGAGHLLHGTAPWNLFADCTQSGSRLRSHNQMRNAPHRITRPSEAPCKNGAGHLLHGANDLRTFS